MHLSNLERPVWLVLQERSRGLHYEMDEIGRGQIIQGLVVRVEDLGLFKENREIT